MQVTFIRPNMTATRSFDAMQPLAFAILAALTPAEIETELYDERIEALPAELESDLIAMTVETFTAGRAYHLSEKFRRRGIPVVMGGYHPTLLPQEALEHADAIVIGDAETTWPALLADAQVGRLRRIYRQDADISLKGIQFDRRIFSGKRYLPLVPIQQSRGCHFACDFCSIHAFYGKTHRQRPVREVLQELEALKQRTVVFIDDNLFTDLRRTREFLTALIPLRLTWTCQISLDIADNGEILDLLAESGCRLATIGFESLDSRNLRQMGKVSNLGIADYRSAVRQFQERGIMIFGTFVFGYDYDTAQSLTKSVEFAVESDFFLANFNPLIPTPGTALYARLQREKRLIYPHWWRDPDYRYGEAIFHPKGMSAEELTQGCFQARVAFHRYRSMLKRAPACRSSLKKSALFWAANLISRKEILKKQGILLGR